MTVRTLILRSLRFHWRAHLGVVLGAAVGSAALIGALVVGDSVRGSLEEMALRRLGGIHGALAPRDRWFRAQLADDLLADHHRLVRNTNEGSFVPALILHASAANTEGSARANQVQLIGVDQRFATLAGPRWAAATAPGTVRVNETLARQLRLSVGETIILRANKPSALSQEAVVSPQADAALALRLRVSDVVPAEELGNFSLAASQVSPFNAFVPLGDLQQNAGTSNQANAILVGELTDSGMRRASAVSALFYGLRSRVLGQNSPVRLQVLNRKVEFYVETGQRVARAFPARYFSWRIQGVWQLADAGLELRELPGRAVAELRSPRIFLDPPAVAAALLPVPVEVPSNTVARLLAQGRTYQLRKLRENRALLQGNTNGRPILTYLVNQFRASSNSTPYSMVTAAGAPLVPKEMRDDEILVNQWLADDLDVKPGDEIALAYFDPDSGARLVEHTNHLFVRGVVPMQLPWLDRTLMPEFPGIEKAERTQDWDAGFPLVHKIRDKDEDYWKQYRGTPKAFVTLAAGQKMWGNRFGNLTAIRFPMPTNGAAANFTDYRAALQKKILDALEPDDLGLRFEPVREQALKAANEAQDFGQLFLGFSFFLIAAALILMALLFQFGLEQRVTEVGTLLALGFTARQVRRLFLWEGVALAAVGGLIGLFGGLAYAWAMLRGLTTLWRDAVNAAALSFHASSTTLVIGAVASVLVSALTLWLTLRKQARQPARELLTGEVTEFRGGGREPVGGLPTRKKVTRALTSAATIGWAALAGAVFLLAWVMGKGDTGNAGAFFGAGSLLLIAGLAFTAALLRRLAEAESRRRFTLNSLGFRGCTRRRNRSLAVAGLLACGSFLIAAIGAFKLDANTNAWRRASGTGGFAFLGESTLPVLRDLNTQEGREFYGLDEGTLAGVSFVPMRVRDGDDASCLNLNRAQKPRLLGVPPELLAQRGAFTFAKAGQASRRSQSSSASETGGTPVLRSPWQLLKSVLRPPPSALEVPAIGDQNSILWAMGKKVGDTLDYVDERGQPFKVRIVGAVANSILQGSLLIDEEEFKRRFPSESGYRMFLIDTPSNHVAAVSAALTRALQDAGLELTPATRRLAAFNAVQNTYLNTFQVLGGLGLLLGSAGLGVVVLRNVLERRGELALLLAVGFRRHALQWLVLSEHGGLLGIGLGLGLGAALVAVLPAVLAPGSEIHYFSLGVTLVAVLGSGFVWVWCATWVALRGQLLDALMNE